MADKPTGPVKPPTLDLTARKTGNDADRDEKKPAPASKPAQPKPAVTPPTGDKAAPADAGPGDKPPAGPEPAAPEPAPVQSVPVIALVATGLGGAVLGLAAAYGLALAGMWPGAGADEADLLGPLDARIARAENTLELANASLSGLEDRIRALETAPAAQIPALPDDLMTLEALEPLDARIEALALRIDATAAGIPAGQSADLAEEIARLGAGLADLEARMDAPDTALETLDTEMMALAGRVETLEAAAATQASVDAMRAERDRFARLPAATAALETAIRTGQPFGNELAAVEALVPEMGLANPIRAIAANGVAPMREIAGDFRALIPALLAARPEDPQAGWFDTLLGQAESVLALRPVDDSAESPEGIVGRIETALEREDAAAARALLLALPAPMQQVAAPVRADLDAVIAAQALVADIRALAPQSGEAAQ